MRTLTFLTCLCAIVSCGLKPKAPELPAATTSGKNTFGCMADDTVYVAKRSGNYLAYDAGYYKPSGTLRISAHNGKDFGYRFYVNISADSIFGPGSYSYDIFRKDDAVVTKHYYENNANDGYFNIDTTAYCLLEITKLDLITPIISGKFEFTAKNPLNGAIVMVKEGRFDFSNIYISE